MSNIIVMAFTPRNIVGCLLKKRLTKGGGGSQAHQDLSPRYALAVTFTIMINIYNVYKPCYKVDVMNLFE